MRTIFIQVCFTLLIPVCQLFAADSLNVVQHEKQIKKQQRSLQKQEKIQEGRMLISPLILPGYTPELQFCIGGGGLISWSTNKSDKLLPRSNMAMGLTISSTGAMVINLRPSTYWASDNFRINGDVWYKDMPDHYWGIGYQKVYDTPQSDSTTSYNRLWYQLRGDAVYRVRSDLFAGLTFDLNYTKGFSPSEGVETDANFREFNDKPFNTGLGPVIRYDSRDVPVNAWKGMYLDAKILFYGPYLGGDNRYNLVLVDYRQYHKINSTDGRTFAWQALSRITWGDVPYGEMSQLGNPFDLRGYIWGQYRDKSMFLWIAEYRHTFFKTDGSLSKNGVVVWIGSGIIYDLEKTNQDNQNEQNKWLPNFGIGYRYELQPRMNLRIDIGVGRESTGFYFNMNEAF